MMTVAQIVSAFREIIGWPYVSPGTNNQNGIDCSGAFVYAYKKYGYSIYHGSNRIIRTYCSNPIRVTSASQLKVGMAILKSRTDLSGLSADYKPGGKYYNANLPDDYYHIGLVASVNPLQIINATTPVARINTTLSGWTTAGYLNAVDYSGDAPAPSPDPPPPSGSTAVTVASTGSTVNLRSQPSTAGSVLARMPLGQTVALLSTADATWWQVRYQSTTGYMMREFLKTDGDASATPPSGSIPSAAITVASTGSTVNLRKQPSTAGSVLMRVPLGQTVQVLSAYDDTWWQVRYETTIGFMMREFLRASA